MKSYLPLFLLFVFTTVFPVQAQNDLEQFKTLFSKTEAYYKDTNTYTIRVAYEFFESENLTKPMESLDGMIQKNGTKYYSKIGSTEMIYLDRDFLKIDHDQKAVLYAKLDHDKNMVPIEITSMMGYFEKAKISKKSGAYYCELFCKPISGLPYKKMILVIDTKKFQILKQELYMMEGLAYPNPASDKQKTIEGKMVVTFTSEENKNVNNTLFKKSNYITEGNDTQLSGKIAKYKLYNSTL